MLPKYNPEAGSTFLSKVENPINEISKVIFSSLGTDNVKSPLTSVIVPFVVPLTSTFAPGSPSPDSESMIDPVILLCAKPTKLINKAKADRE